MYSKQNYQGSQSSYPSEPFSFPHFNMKHPVISNSRPCLFGMNIFKPPRLSSLFVTKIFKLILLFLLSIKRWPLNKNFSELFVLMHDTYLSSQFTKLLRKQYRPSIMHRYIEIDSYKVSINSTKYHMHLKMSKYE